MSEVNNDRPARVIEVNSVEVAPKIPATSKDPSLNVNTSASKLGEVGGGAGGSSKTSGAGHLNYSGAVASNSASNSIIQQEILVQNQIQQQQEFQSQQLAMQAQTQNDPNNSSSASAARRRLGNMTGPHAI